MRIAHVSTFPPLKCGIAFFAADLAKALSDADHYMYSLHYGGGAAPNATAHANVNSPDEVIALAKAISASDCDVVAVQHEFGIWGGAWGENLVPFLDNLTKPILSVLHTTFGPGVRPHVQCMILKRLIQQSTRIVLLTETAKRTTEALIRRSLTNAIVIPHGVPRFPYQEPPPLGGNGNRATLRLITPGFLRPDKGFEVVLKALRRLRSKGHDVSYLLAGEAQGQFSGQTIYRRKVEQLIRELDLSQVVCCDTRFLSVEEQVEAIQNCHLGVFAYQDHSQSSSGAVPLVMSVGRPVVCTPFEYAQSRSQDGVGVTLAEGFDEQDLAGAIERFLHVEQFAQLTNTIYRRTSTWAWTKVGSRFEHELRLAAGNASRHGHGAPIRDALDLDRHLGLPNL